MMATFLGGCTGMPGRFFLHSPANQEVNEDLVSPEGDTEIGETVFPINAGSWGGKVRAGPGMEYEHVASLKEGDPVVLIGVSDVVMNGYPWFQIKYRDELEGYKWGGILCATNEWVDGLHRQCTNSEVLEDLELQPDISASALDQIELALRLLPGRWQSNSDPNSVMVFDRNRATFDIHDSAEVATGTWTVEESDVSPTKVTIRRVIDGHTSVYSLLLVSSEELSISFLPRGITLSYRRVE
jgi:hypothetical protein